ncbi:unnamed protein product [Pleuronectes platessa]|uniref:Uncharacterized protein n=1 Tax=Pleuronectes platessa TaxID=8262 RepID=A0A9N7TW71_PLEPL|nr:unnamed protein product [Pleuronectes platessa]
MSLSCGQRRSTQTDPESDPEAAARTRVTSHGKHESASYRHEYVCLFANCVGLKGKQVSGKSYVKSVCRRQLEDTSPSPRPSGSFSCGLRGREERRPGNGWLDWVVSAESGRKTTDSAAQMTRHSFFSHKELLL